MPGFRTVCCLLIAVWALASEAWRPADHPAAILRPIAALTRPVHIVAVAAEVAGRVRDPGPAMGSLIGDAMGVQLDDSLAQAERVIAAVTLTQAEAEANFRRREGERIANLFGQGRISEGERDAATHAAEAADLARARAAAELARRQRLVDLHRVDLPAGWQVLRRHREAGSVVQPGEPILEVGDPTAVVATVHLDEAEIAALAQATATVGGSIFPIQAVRSSALADAQSRKRPVEIELPGAAGGGREVLVTLRLPDPSGALAIPTALIRADLDGRFVRTDDGRSLRVTILRSTGDDLVAVLPDPALLSAALVPPAQTP